MFSHEGLTALNIFLKYADNKDNFVDVGSGRVAILIDPAKVTDVDTWNLKCLGFIACKHGCEVSGGEPCFELNAGENSAFQ